jgi:hypothetical protein
MISTRSLILDWLTNREAEIQLEQMASVDSFWKRTPTYPKRCEIYNKYSL